MSGVDYKAVWDEVKANSAKLQACPMHHFAGGPVTIGQRHTCLRCGGQMSGSDLLWYIRGYTAAPGTEADDIYPGWNVRKSDA